MAQSQQLLSTPTAETSVAEASAASAWEVLWAAIGWDVLIVVFVVTFFLLIRLLTTGRLLAPHLKAKGECSASQKASALAAQKLGIDPEGSTSLRQRQAPSRAQRAEPAAPATSPAEEAFCKNIRALLSSGDLSGAAAAFQQAGQQLCEFDQAASLLLQALKAFSGSGDRAGLAWDLYSATKDHVEYSRTMYHVLVSALARQGDAERSDKVLRDMTLQNVMPDLATYSSLIRGHVARGDLERSLQLLSQMQRRGINPDLPAYHVVLEACAQRQMPTLTEQVLQDMVAAGISPSNATLATLIRLYGRCGDMGAALWSFKTFPSKYNFKVNTQVFASLIAALAADGDVAKAFEIYEQMTCEGNRPDAATYKALLSGSLQDGDLDAASRLIDDAFCSGASNLLARESIELFLLQAVRRGRGTELAAPVLQRARQASIFVSERIASNVQRACQ